MVGHTTHQAHGTSTAWRAFTSIALALVCWAQTTQIAQADEQKARTDSAVSAWHTNAPADLSELRVIVRTRAGAQPRVECGATASCGATPLSRC